jgi:hypothetical protein
MSFSEPASTRRGVLSLSFRTKKLLIALFILTIPFTIARIRGDGIGYYAYARSLIVDHNLQFKGDWKAVGSEPFVVVRDSHGFPVNSHLTKTGHIPNYFAVGPAMLWAPFVAVTHAGILILRHMGYAIAADGHGRPYVWAMAFATALYGFLGLLFSFQLARAFAGEKWAFLATVTIWLASSLPVYMYVDPSWAHAQSAFAVAWFLWYWHRTSAHRSRAQWMIWGLISGLMCDVYFANSVFLLVPILDFLSEGRKALREGAPLLNTLQRALSSLFIYFGAIVVAFLPTLAVRQIIFGNPLAPAAYASQPWRWESPEFWSILFSSSRGLFVCTPVLILAVAGLFFVRRKQPALGNRLLACTAAFYALIAVYPWWDGVASFGNRFFISLTPVFVVGLAATFERFIAIWQDSRRAMRRAVAVAAVLILWNLGLVYQWSTGLLPNVGPVNWAEVVYNQVRVVPGDILATLRSQDARVSAASVRSAR